MAKPNPSIADVRSALRCWKGKRVVIFGDMILDEFIHGRTDRVSREAPVVIVRYEGSAFCPGGAANAAQNVAALGGVAVPIGVVGADEAADRLAALLEERKVSTRGLVTATGRVTTSKVRVSAGDYHAQQQQIVRIDRERRRPLRSAVRERLLRLLAREAERADAVILSDYQQDLFDGDVAQRAVAVCATSRVPVIADSRFRLPRFKGVTSATPNEVEAAEAAGVAATDELALEKVGRTLLKRLSCSSILITRGRFGMSLFERRKKTRSIGVFGHPEATDVTGAGDTVVSAVALTLAAGQSMGAAMYLANAAAARVVMKRGTAVTSVSEIGELLDDIERAGGSVGT